MSQAKPYSAPAMAGRTAAILFVFVIIFTGLLALVHQWTSPAIEASLASEKMRFINEVLPEGSYDNNLLQDTRVLPPAPKALGNKTAETAYIARQQGKPVAVVLEAVAPDGYAGEIRLVMGITKTGAVSGVRVIQHKETPGLGDYIDPKKDRDKQNPWISQFSALETHNLTPSDWKVKKDGGHFLYRAGATITPRAIVQAVHKAVQYTQDHQNELFVQEAQ